GGEPVRRTPVLGRYDASYGLLLSGTGDGRFEAVDMERSGLVIEGQVRHMGWLSGPGPAVAGSLSWRETTTGFSCCARSAPHGRGPGPSRAVPRWRGRKSAAPDRAGAARLRDNRPPAGWRSPPPPRRRPRSPAPGPCSRLSSDR